MQPRFPDIRPMDHRADALVYVAGPILGSGNPFRNVSVAMEAGINIMREGGTPYIPHLDFTMAVAHPHITREEYLAWDFAIIERCDALLRLPGESDGADREVAHAEAHGVTVFHDKGELGGWLKERTYGRAPAPSEDEDGEEAVQRLQRERDKLKAEVFRLHERLDSRARVMTVRLERILDLEAEIARLRDPANWRVEHEGRLLPYTLTRLHYIGPSDSTEAEQDDFEQYADEAVREIARIMDDSTEADEGENDA